MKIKTGHLLFSNIRLLKGLSVILLIYFSGALVHNSVKVFYQEQINNQVELCDFPFTETENSSESESHKKNSFENSEEFLALDKSDFSLFLVENNLIFYSKNNSLTDRIKELPTPPPKQAILTV